MVELEQMVASLRTQEKLIITLWVEEEVLADL